MKPEKIFRAVCDAESVKAAIAELDASALAELLQYLDGFTGGIPALVLGAAQIEAANRFIQAHLP